MRYSYLVKPTIRAYQDMYRFYRPASSLYYAHNVRYLVQTQDVAVGLGPEKPGSDAGARRARSHRGYPAVSYLFVLEPGSGAEELTGCQPTQRSKWCASEFQRRTPLSIHVEIMCGRTGVNDIDVGMT